MKTTTNTAQSKNHHDSDEGISSSSIPRKYSSISYSEHTTFQSSLPEMSLEKLTGISIKNSSAEGKANLQLAEQREEVIETTLAKKTELKGGVLQSAQSNRPFAKEEKKDNNAVQVFVRVRPMNQREKTWATQQQETPHPKKRVGIIKTSNSSQIIVMDPDLHSGNDASREKCFAFDGAFSEADDTARVFASTISPILSDHLLQGYNATLFAYGQTGAGKTYTLLGKSTTTTNSELLGDSMQGISASSHGLIGLAVQELFSLFGKDSSAFKHTAKASYLEIYNETVRDLLVEQDKQAPLLIVEDPTKGIIIPELTEYAIVSAKELISLVEKGNTIRVMASTHSNEFSSRSHCILQISIEKTPLEEGGNQQDVSKPIFRGQKVTSKLSLIDLAGSERAAVSDNKGIRMVEGSKINRSLLALGNCINILSDARKQGAYVPYRDSKLTRLLKDSLGGNAQTLMVACIAPTSLTYEETLNTLKYAARAKNIKNKVRQNIEQIDLQVSRYKEVIDSLKLEVESLKRQLNQHARENLQQQQLQIGQANGNPADGGNSTGAAAAEMEELSKKILLNIEENWEITQTLKDLEQLRKVNEANMEKKQEELRLIKGTQQSSGQMEQIDSLTAEFNELLVNMENNEHVFKEMSNNLSKNSTEKEQLREKLRVLVAGSGEEKSLEETCRLLQLEKIDLCQQNYHIKQAAASLAMEKEQTASRLKEMEKEMARMKQQLLDKDHIITQSSMIIHQLQAKGATEINSINSSSTNSLSIQGQSAEGQKFKGIFGLSTSSKRYTKADDHSDTRQRRYSSKEKDVYYGRKQEFEEIQRRSTGSQDKIWKANINNNGSFHQHQHHHERSFNKNSHHQFQQQQLQSSCEKLKSGQSRNSLEADELLDVQKEYYYFDSNKKLQKRLQPQQQSLPKQQQQQQQQEYIPLQLQVQQLSSEKQQKNIQTNMESKGQSSSSCWVQQPNEGNSQQHDGINQKMHEQEKEQGQRIENTAALRKNVPNSAKSQGDKKMQKVQMNLDTLKKFEEIQRQRAVQKQQEQQHAGQQGQDNEDAGMLLDSNNTKALAVSAKQTKGKNKKNKHRRHVLQQQQQYQMPYATEKISIQDLKNYSQKIQNIDFGNVKIKPDLKKFKKQPEGQQQQLDKDKVQIEEQQQLNEQVERREHFQSQHNREDLLTAKDIRIHSSNNRDCSENQKGRINRDTSRNKREQEQQVRQKEVKTKESDGYEDNDMKEQLKEELLGDYTSIRQNGNNNKESSLALRKIILSQDIPEKSSESECSTPLRFEQTERQQITEVQEKILAAQQLIHSARNKSDKINKQDQQDQQRIGGKKEQDQEGQKKQATTKQSKYLHQNQQQQHLDPQQQQDNQKEESAFDYQAEGDICDGQEDNNYIDDQASPLSGISMMKLVCDNNNNNSIDQTIQEFISGLESNHHKNHHHQHHQSDLKQSPTKQAKYLGHTQTSSAKSKQQPQQPPNRTYAGKFHLKTLDEARVKVRSFRHQLTSLSERLKSSQMTQECLAQIKQILWVQEEEKFAVSPQEEAVLSEFKRILSVFHESMPKKARTSNAQNNNTPQKMQQLQQQETAATAITGTSPFPLPSQSSDTLENMLSPFNQNQKWSIDNVVVSQSEQKRSRSIHSLGEESALQGLLGFSSFKDGITAQVGSSSLSSSAKPAVVAISTPSTVSSKKPQSSNSSNLVYHAPNNISVNKRNIEQGAFSKILNNYGEAAKVIQPNSQMQQHAKKQQQQQLQQQKQPFSIDHDNNHKKQQYLSSSSNNSAKYIMSTTQSNSTSKGACNAEKLPMNESKETDGLAYLGVAETSNNSNSNSSIPPKNESSNAPQSQLIFAPGSHRSSSDNLFGVLQTNVSSTGANSRQGETKSSGNNKTANSIIQCLGNANQSISQNSSNGNQSSNRGKSVTSYVSINSKRRGFKEDTATITASTSSSVHKNISNNTSNRDNFIKSNISSNKPQDSDGNTANNNQPQ